MRSSRKQVHLAKRCNKLARGRERFERREWADAFEALKLADREDPLGANDLQLLAICAYLVGHEDDYLRALERSHQLLLEDGECVRAARCAFWIGLCLLFRGSAGPATGWLARAQRLVARDGRACAEQGYLLLPRAERDLASLNAQAAYTSATQAVEIGERFADADLIACARHIQGRARLLQGRLEQGLSLLDETMVAVVAGELSPIMTGLVYCSVIDSCMQVYSLARAREWTSELARWCGSQPQLVAFTGTCLVHRAEIMELNGAWPDATREAQRACSGSPSHVELQPPPAAFYRRGELFRLRGELAAANEFYSEASRRGYDPQPGLSLLRMAEGRNDAAAVALRRALNATADPLVRTRLLPAFIEIMLGVGAIDEVHSACRELEEIADSLAAGAVRAMAAQARGSVQLAHGDPEAALCSLQAACEFWRGAQAPYLMARVRELMGMACRLLGDEDGARLELEAARTVFSQLGAVLDLARVSSHLESSASPTHGLTKRELQVLQLVAAGKTNRTIAAELFVSQRTVDRHISNLFGKLEVPTRTAATAYAHRHKLV